MPLSRIATKNLKDYDLYVKVTINVNDDLEFQICYKPDDVVLCDNIYTIGALENALENWG